VRMTRLATMFGSLVRLSRDRAAGLWLPALLAVTAMLLAGCYNSTTGDTTIHGIAEFKLPVVPETGSHRVMVFSEMHYQPSYRSQEAPRLLPNPEAVPYGGLGSPGGVVEHDMILKEIVPGSLAEYGELKIPQSVKESYDPEHAQELFRVNCSVCHGLEMRGDSMMASMMEDKGLGPVPADLMAPITLESPEGEIFAFISRGGRQGYALIEAGLESRSPMPEFLYLLSEDDRWALVQYLKDQTP
jgi:mono/diheme cytochrome c family protein